MDNDKAGREALAALDRTLRHRPEKDSEDFAHASMCLAVMRDGMIARQRVQGDMTESLARINGVMSVVLGGHFPLGKIPWPAVQAARDALTALLNEQGTPSPM